MDNTLSTLKAAKHISLSSNVIEKITGYLSSEIADARPKHFVPQTFADHVPTCVQCLLFVTTVFAPSEHRLKGCESCEILSLGRNQIKKLDGVEDVAETLQAQTHHEMRARAPPSVCTRAHARTQAHATIVTILKHLTLYTNTSHTSRALQELWISYNLLQNIKGAEKLTKLRVFYVTQVFALISSSSAICFSQRCSEIVRN